MPPATAGAAAAASADRAREHLLQLLEPVVTDAGYDLEDVSVTSAGRRSLVRVTVDADGGIDLDAVAVVSRLVSDALDAVAVVSRLVSDALDADAQNPASPRALAGAYVLEVSSPGVDRPLTEPRHWRRATGRLVKVDVEGGTVTGRIAGVDDAGVTLELDGGGTRTVAFADLGRGKVQVEFNRPGDGIEEE